MASTAFPGHSEGTVTRRVKHAASGTSTTKQVPCPLMLTKYNHSMGGFDKSDQYISYHKVLRPTVKNWKTTSFHVLDICSVNSHIHYNWYRLKNSSAILPKKQFRVLLYCKSYILHNILRDAETKLTQAVCITLHSSPESQQRHSQPHCTR